MERSYIAGEETNDDRITRPLHFSSLLNVRISLFIYSQDLKSEKKQWTWKDCFHLIESKAPQTSQLPPPHPTSPSSTPILPNLAIPSNTVHNGRSILHPCRTKTKWIFNMFLTQVKTWYLCLFLIPILRSNVQSIFTLSHFRRLWDCFEDQDSPRNTKKVGRV